MKQTDRLAAWLKEHREIDPLTAWRELGIYRLAARIKDLREAGFKIARYPHKVRNQFGEPVRVALYRLEGEA